MRILSSLILVLFAALLTAADAPATPAASGNDGNSSNEQRGSRRFGRGGRMGMRGGRFMEQLKEKYPQEVAEIEKLRSSDPEGARTKMFELMRKANPEMTMRGGRRRDAIREVEPTAEQLAELKAKFPAEFAEYEKVKTSDPEKAKNLLRELLKKAYGEQIAENTKNLRDRSRRSVAMVKMELKRLYPERFSKIEKLAETDPDAAREEMRKLFKESNLRMMHGARELNYEYVDPKLNNQFNRPGMMNMRFPYGNRGNFNGMPWRR